MMDLSGQPVTPDDMLNGLQFVAESEFYSVYVCEEDGKILGLLGFGIRENVEEVSRFGEVSALEVNTDDRLKGVGRLMMQYAEKLAREMGCQVTWLVSGFAREEDAHKFYQRLGYQTTGYRFVKLFE
jgi:GNAT superfamily N-acetyltransferase